MTEASALSVASQPTAPPTISSLNFIHHKIGEGSTADIHTVEQQDDYSTADTETTAETTDSDEWDEHENYSICSIALPASHFSTDIPSTDILSDDDSVTSIETVPVCNTTFDSKPSKPPFNKANMDLPRAQIDTGAKASVTNCLHLLHNVKFYSETFPCRVRMYGATNKELLICPEAVGMLRIPALNQIKYIDIECFYSPSFSSTLLSDNDIIKATGHHKDFYGQSIDKFFDHDEEQIQHDIKEGDFNIEKRDYNKDTGHCIIVCHHKVTRNKNIIIPGIIKHAQCFTRPIIIPNLPEEHPAATACNSFAKAYKDDPSLKQQ